jgi:outer membrane protein assembly factor BamD (BamD/ComL family)
VSEQAAFMIGFTYAEELDDYASARTAFEEFLRTHPKSDLAQSAKWMLENMDKPNPPFEGEAPADSAGSREGK